MLDSGIADLQASAGFVVLHHCVVLAQFMQRRKHIVGAETFVSQICGDAELPIVIEIVDQGRLRENTFKPQAVGEKPDQTAARSDNWVLIQRATQANHAENFVFFERERDENFPWDIEGIARDAVLKINARVEFEAGASVILDHVFNCQMSVDRLEVIGQSIISAAKIVALVLKASAEIPLAGNEKTMVVAEIVIKRITLAQARLVFEIAAKSVNAVVRKEIERVFFFILLRLRGLLHLRLGSGEEAASSGKNRKDPRNK